MRMENPDFFREIRFMNVDQFGDREALGHVTSAESNLHEIRQVGIAEPMSTEGFIEHHIRFGWKCSHAGIKSDKHDPSITAPAFHPIVFRKEVRIAPLLDAQLLNDLSSELVKHFPSIRPTIAYSRVSMASRGYHTTENVAAFRVSLAGWSAGAGDMPSGRSTYPRSARNAQRLSRFGSTRSK